MVHRRAIAVALLAAAVVVGVVALQLVDDGVTRVRPGSGLTTTTTREPGA